MQTPPPDLSHDAILAVVLDALRATNQVRDEGAKLKVSDDAPLFGPDSALDSLGLVALLLDIEEALEARGCPVLLSDERAMSQRRSPFRSVPSLVDYIGTLVRA